MKIIYIILWNIKRTAFYSCRFILEVINYQFVAIYSTDVKNNIYLMLGTRVTVIVFLTIYFYQ